MKFRADPERLRALMAERNLTMSGLADASEEVTGHRVDHTTIARALRGDALQMATIARIRATLKAVPVDDAPDILAS